MCDDDFLEAVRVFLDEPKYVSNLTVVIYKDALYWNILTQLKMKCNMGASASASAWEEARQSVSQIAFD